MSTVEETFRSAIRLHQQGQIKQAQRVYMALLDSDQQHSDAWHLLGVTHHQLGDMSEAIRCINTALSLRGPHPTYYNNLSAALRAAGRKEEAQKAVEQAIALRPNYADAYANYGLLALDRGDWISADGAFQKTLELSPGHADALYNYGNLHFQRGQHSEAIHMFELAAAVAPHRADVLNNLGTVLLAQRKYPEAIETYRRALSIDPSFADAYGNLAAALVEFDHFDEAEAAFSKAAQLCPTNPLLQLRSISHSPTVFSSSEAIDAYRQKLDEALDDHRFIKLPSENEIVQTGVYPSFNLAHHSRDDRPIKEKFGRLFHRGFAQRTPAPKSGKPRVGFVVTRHHEGGFVRGMGPILERISTDRFELVVLCSAAVAPYLRKAIRQDGLEVIGFPDVFDRAADIIHAAGCHVLCHWQIGSDPLNYFLAYPRLAPVQCTSWGTHTTSGVPNINYYLSSKLWEPEIAQRHFSEQLWLFDSLLVCHEPIQTTAIATRTQFGLPEYGALYGCLQRLNKFHPELDYLLAGILRADPTGHVVAIKGSQEYAYQALKKRFSATMPDVMERVLFLPSPAYADYLSTLSVCDVVLDIPQFGGGFTSYDALAYGIPIVALPGHLHQMGRYAPACYQRMGIEGPIANSPDEYVRLAVELGTDRERNRALRQRIALSRDSLFNDTSVVRAYEEFFQHAIDNGV